MNFGKSRLDKDAVWGSVLGGPKEWCGIHGEGWFWCPLVSSGFFKAFVVA